MNNYQQEIVAAHLGYEGIDSATAWRIVRMYDTDSDIYENFPDLRERIAKAFDAAYQVILGC